MNIYVIIVTYNATKNNWLRKCLNSLRNSQVELNTLVIDNNSTDETVNIIENEFPTIELIKSTKNLGFAKANNIGMKIALENNADYVFLLNQDAWIESDTIVKLVNCSSRNSDFGIISPIHLTGAGDLLDAGFVIYASNPSDEGRKLYTDLLRKQLLKEVYSVNFVNAAAWLITRDCIEKVGFFDDQLFIHYGEDDNYSQRVLYNKLKIGIVPNSFIYHDRENRENRVNNFEKDDIIFNFKKKYSNIFLDNIDSLFNNEIKHEKKKAFLYLLIFKFSKAQRIMSIIKDKQKLFSIIKKNRIKY